MRKSIFLLSSMLVASLCGAGCSSSQKQASATDETEAVFACTDSVTTECDGVKLTQIRDNAQERLMQLSLFGELPQTLIDSLNIGQGVPASVSAFLLEIDGKRILFDTGMGAPDSRLLTNLSAAGVTPADIDYLYLTHFHGDHIGGMMKGDTVVFPKAEVYAAQQEYDAWMQMPDDKKTQVAATMEAYKDRLHLVAYGDTLPCGVVALDCVGHTPGTHRLPGRQVPHRGRPCAWRRPAVGPPRDLRRLRHGPAIGHQATPLLPRLCPPEPPAVGRHAPAGRSCEMTPQPVYIQRIYISFVRLNSLSAKSSARPEICL